jgi:hypothetical protein
MPLVSGREKSGAGLPRGNILEGVRAMDLPGKGFVTDRILFYDLEAMLP